MVKSELNDEANVVAVQIDKQEEADAIYIIS
jgi:hypothetical protein